MQRRALLTGMMALAVSQVACQSSAAQRLRASILKGSVPPQMVSGLRQGLPDDVQFQSEIQGCPLDLFQQLQALHRPDQQGGWRLRWPWAADPSEQRPTWVSLGDYWLTAAIQQGLVQSIPVGGLTQWRSLPEPWSPLVTRNDQGMADARGAVWGAPYRWGCLVIAYARRPFEKLGWQPQTWTDLWRSELQGRVIVPDHPRVLLGMVLKSLEASANQTSPQTVTGIQDALAGLRSQVKAYGSRNYLEPLIREDAWVAVGWSTDVRPVLDSYRQLAATVPAPGTLLSADLWVRPAPLETANGPAELSKADQHWLDYWWLPETAVPMSLSSGGLSPRFLGPEATQWLEADDIAPQGLLLPSSEQLAASDFLLPLPPTAVTEYADLWQQLRQPS
jgi:putative spermidine/putrescine transport system substrate-binding protein